MAVGIQEISEKSGYHNSTVSLALRDSPKISESTRKKIKRIARQLNYVPNFSAKHLRGQQTKTIGIMATEIHDPYVANLISAQEKVLQAAGYVPLLVGCNWEKGCEAEVKGLEEIQGRGVDGLVLDYWPENQKVFEKICQLHQDGFPVVALGEPYIEGIDYVTYDVSEAGYKITRYLLGLGHRRIAIVTGNYKGSSTVYKSDHKRFGYEKALREAGVELEQSLIVHREVEDERSDKVFASLMTLKERPTAIFCTNDRITEDMLRHFLNKGYRVPEDVSIVGIGDLANMDLFVVPLTMYPLAPREYGMAMAQMILARIENPQMEQQSKVFAGELIERRSCQSII